MILIFLSCPYRCFFALMSVSGLFSVTFSVLFAYVADITEEEERSTAYGLVNKNTSDMMTHLYHEYDWQFLSQGRGGCDSL